MKRGRLSFENSFEKDNSLFAKKLFDHVCFLNMSATMVDKSNFNTHAQSKYIESSKGMKLDTCSRHFYRDGRSHEEFTHVALTFAVTGKTS